MSEHHKDSSAAREMCKGCSGSGLVGRDVTCPYCFGSGRSIYVVTNAADDTKPLLPPFEVKTNAD